MIFQNFIKTNFGFSEIIEDEKYDNLIRGMKFGDFWQKSQYFRPPINSIPRIMIQINMSRKVSKIATSDL